MKSPKFPEDYQMHKHHIEDCFQWLYSKESNSSNCLISIVAGPHMYGDGYSTFEMWDKRNEGPLGYLTREEINRHFIDNPLNE